MALPSDHLMIAPVLDLSRFRRRTQVRSTDPRATAELLSVRRSLAFEASIEIDDLDRWLHRLDGPTGTAIAQRVRRLLDREFGRLRVHRSRHHFIVRHRAMEALIAALLRAQFHALQIPVPLRDRHGERIEPASISITWGVGRSAREAEMERVRRRRQKQRSR